MGDPSASAMIVKTAKEDTLCNDTCVLQYMDGCLPSKHGAYPNFLKLMLPM